jgi:hypothetical protein
MALFVYIAQDTLLIMQFWFTPFFLSQMKEIPTYLTISPNYNCDWDGVVGAEEKRA